MRVFALSAFVMSLVLTQPAFADMRELSRSELRESVRQGKSLSFSSALSVVTRQFDGEVVDVRAFESDAVYYRILIKSSGGVLGAIIMDAGTGRLMPSESTAVREVTAAAKSSKGSSGSNKGRGNNNAGGKGNAGGGNGNGNGKSGSKK